MMEPPPLLSPSNSSSSSSKKASYKTESNQVRYTGDWSADSKLSAINNGYWEDPFFKFFNTTDPSRIRRTSLICRGYYVRFRVCDYFLRRIIREINQPVQIVSLGCGMDTGYFRLLPELENLILRFYELDFKSVITAKKSIILHNDILQVMAADKLRLLHCDLRHVKTLEDALKSGGFDFQKPTLFYSECVVNYLRPHENLKILQWITEHVPNSIWLAYEQTNINDSFGQIMVSHFLRNGCPLLSLISAQNCEDQEAQLKKANFEEAKVINVWDAFLKIGAEDPPYFPMGNKREQQFDEYEQLLATCLHYSVRIGVSGSFLHHDSNGLVQFLDEFYSDKDKELLGGAGGCRKETVVEPPAPPQSSYYKMKSFPLSSLPKLTGHRATVTSDGTILTFGGSGENSRRMKHLIASSVDFNNIPATVITTAGIRNKSNNLLTSNVDLILDDHEDGDDDNLWKSGTCDVNELVVNTRIVSENSKFYERLHSSAIYIPSGVKDGETADSVLIFGGRKSPMNPCVNDLIELHLENPLLTGDNIIGSIILSSTYGKCPPARWRHAMALCSKGGSPYLFLFGGRNTEAVLDDCWYYSIEDFSWSERIIPDYKEETTHSINGMEPTGRHSHSMVSDSDGTLIYMLGGMSENDAALCQDAFWIYDTTTNKWTNVESLNYFVRRIGHVALKHKNNLIIFGGYGANSSYSLDFFAIVIDLETNIVKPIHQAIPREELFLPFGFSACLMNSKDEIPVIIVFGGGGNCFSFGSHYNQVCFTITLGL